MIARMARWLPLMIAMPLLASVPPSDWIPARWNGTNPQTLDLLSNTPINCLLLDNYTPEFMVRAAARGLIALAVLKPGGDPAELSRKAIHAGLQGIVLEGDFPKGTAAQVRDSLAGTHATVVELTSRAQMPLSGTDPIIGTYQGVWPGIQVMENGAVKAAPSGSAWIDTNTGFIRSARAWGSASIWLGYLPPAHSVIASERYLAAISDAEMAGARWIVSLDADLSSRLEHGDAAAAKVWHAMAGALQFFESHPEWRAMRPLAKLAVVEDSAADAVFSGVILEMSAAQHIPMRAIPGPLLTAGSLEGVSVAVDVNADALMPAQREILKNFARSGGTVLTASPGRVNDILHDVQTATGRKNMGARLFNVSSMLSNVLTSEDGKQVVVEMVNYSAYPIEDITVQVLGHFQHARLLTPDGGEKNLEVYSTEEGGTGVDIARVPACAAVRLD